jgi:hypothetical protein
MGLIDNKRDVFNQIGALTSIKDDFRLPDVTSSFSSINNTNEITPFLLDLLTTLIGSESLERATGELMTDFIRNVEPTLKEELLKQFSDFNSEDVLPAGFTAGYAVPASDIDVFEKLKTDPASQTGSLLYNQDANDFDRKAYEAIINPNTDIVFNNLVINYDEVGDNFVFKPAQSTQTIGEFVSGYVGGLTLINESEFISKIIDIIFGTVTNGQNKTDSQAVFEEKINRTIQKLINEEEDITINDSELREIETQGKSRVAGINTVDVGCGVIVNNVTLDSLNSLITGTTSSDDPLTVGREYTNALVGSFDEGSQARAQEDRQTIKDNFFKRLIDAIVNILVSAIIVPPQIRALITIFSGFKNNDIPDIGNPLDDFAAKRDLFNCLVKVAKAAINEFLFDLIKRELLKLIIPVSKIIFKEKINQYLAIIRSLTGFLN